MPGKRLLRRILRRRSPSYQEGEFRDPSISQAQDPDFQAEDLKGVIRGTVRDKRHKTPP
jgi:hypothetical protein